MIDEDPRFPNRRMPAWEQPRFGDELADSKLQDPNGEETVEEQLPLSTYEIIGSAPKSSDAMPAEADLHIPIVVDRLPPPLSLQFPGRPYLRSGFPEFGNSRKAQPGSMPRQAWDSGFCWNHNRSHFLAYQQPQWAV